MRRGRQADADPPRHARPDRAAADARRDRGVREGHVARRVREGRRSPAGLAAIRRSLGPDVARRRAVRARTIRAASIPMGRGYAPYPNAYLYRDWVIKAFNDDLPYDQFVKAQIAGDLLDEQTRARTLPALGLLGLGPVVLRQRRGGDHRADERHDRVDVVSRGFLGLTVACARCHDHKYDPDPDQGLLLARRRVPQHRRITNTRWRRRPVVEDVQGAREEDRAEAEAAQRVSRNREPAARRRRSRCTPSKYLQAAWRVTGEPKERSGRVADQEKLDYELFDRWIAFSPSRRASIPTSKTWQEMIKRGGTAAEAKKLADEFQALLLEVMFAKKEIDEENDIIRAKALPGTKKKKPANLPNEFITNDDFCPGCGLELKSLETDQMQLWTDVFRRDLAEGFDPAFAFDYIKPGRAQVPRLGPRAPVERRSPRARRRAARATSRSCEGDCRRSSPTCTACAMSRSRRPCRSTCAATRIGWATRCRAASSACSARRRRRRSRRAAAGSSSPRRSPRSRSPRASSSTAIWKGHFGTGIVNTPSNFGVNGERPTHPELLEYLAQSFVDNGMSIKKLHREIMLSPVYQLERGPRRQPAPPRIPATVCIGAPTAGA